jgi:CBS domain-containing protein
LSSKKDRDAVRGIMSKKVITLTPTRKTIDALEAMVKKDIGAVVIMERGKLYGIITERDIVRKITKDFDYLDTPLKETATRPLVTVSPSTPIWEAFAKMLRNKIRRLPVVKDEKLVGIVTERDLFKWAVRIAYEPNLPEDVRKLVS